MPTAPKQCVNPVCSRVARANGRCTACYQFHRRTGSDRSEAQIVTSGYRRLVRDIERTHVFAVR